MLYAVGTHIDLRYLNETSDKQATDRPPLPPRRQYAIGTKIIFLNLAPGLEILKVRTPQTV